MKNCIFLSLVFLLFFSCKENNETKNDNDKTNVVQSDDVAKPVNYSVIQSDDTLAVKKILIVVIDPHGSGITALSHFSNIVKKYNCTIIGLNDVRNNEPDFLNKIGKDINSAIENLHLEVEKLFIVGFSGGARMAFNFSSVQQVSGVLMCGAGAPQQAYQNLNFPLALIIGIKDFNFKEQYYSSNSQLVKDLNLLSLVFQGKHQWPPEEQIDLAISFLFAKNHIISSMQSIDYQQIADSYIAEKNYYFAYKTLEAGFKSLTADKQLKIKQSYDKLINSSDFKSYMTEFENVLTQETNTEQLYIQVLPQKNIDWWKTEIDNIRKSTKTADSIKSYSYSRILSYLGVIMYSFVNNEISNPYSANIDKYLQIYEYLEPQNPDLWFFKAVRQKMLGNEDKSYEFYQKAVDLGFSDINKANQFGLF